MRTLFPFKVGTYYYVVLLLFNYYIFAKFFPSRRLSNDFFSASVREFVFKIYIYIYVFFMFGSIRIILILESAS